MRTLGGILCVIPCEIPRSNLIKNFLQNVMRNLKKIITPESKMIAEVPDETNSLKMRNCRRNLLKKKAQKIPDEDPSHGIPEGITKETSREILSDVRHEKGLFQKKKTLKKQEENPQ